MSFRTAYNSLGRKTPSRNSQTTPYRDPTPEQWAKKMDDYYIQQRKKSQ